MLTTGTQQGATTCASPKPLQDPGDDVADLLCYHCFRTEHLLPRHWRCSGSERLHQLPYLPVTFEQCQTCGRPWKLGNLSTLQVPREAAGPGRGDDDTGGATTKPRRAQHVATCEDEGNAGALRCTSHGCDLCLRSSMRQLRVDLPRMPLLDVQCWAEGSC